VPGQHYVVRLTAPDGYRAERSYSVASPPEDRGCIELTVERLADGEVSGYLHDAVRVGDAVEVRGPFGGWFVWRGDAPALLVGGGSGVVPLMAMLRSRRARGSDVPMHLVVSARSREDLFYGDELLQEFAGDATVTLSRAVPQGFARPPGRLAVADLAPWVRAPGMDGADVFVCGSTGFAGAAETLLQDAGVPAGRIRVERFGPS
jgi:ferredoxin-NADP reductase